MENIYVIYLTRINRMPGYEDWVSAHYMYSSTSVDNIIKKLKYYKECIDKDPDLFCKACVSPARYVDYVKYWKPRRNPGPDSFDDLMIIESSFSGYDMVSTIDYSLKLYIEGDYTIDDNPYTDHITQMNYFRARNTAYNELYQKTMDRIMEEVYK